MDEAPAGPSRRRFLTGAAGLVGGGIVSVATRDLLLAPAAAAAPRPSITARREWGSDLVPTGPLPLERPGDVKFLLVHHTAGANGYPREAVRSTLRGIFSYHTGPKGWNDVAYNFFVDAYGGIWEGRQGSLEGPVKGDATGGSQGFAQLCCFLGDHQVTPPSAAAQAAMSDLLAWLAGVYAIDLRPGATASFVSRGSNRHPAGKQVTTSTIAAHRDMSSTTCPGDACYALVKGEMSRTAAAKAGAAVAAAPLPSAPDPPAPTAPTAPATVVDPPAPPTTPPPASATQVGEDDPPSTVAAGPPRPVELTGVGRSGPERGSPAGRILGLGGAGALGAGLAAVLVRRRRSRVAAESRWYSSELLNPREDGQAPLPPVPEGAPAPGVPDEMDQMERFRPDQ